MAASSLLKRIHLTPSLNSALVSSTLTHKSQCSVLQFGCKLVVNHELWVNVWDCEYSSLFIERITQSQCRLCARSISSWLRFYDIHTYGLYHVQESRIFKWVDKKTGPQTFTKFSGFVGLTYWHSFEGVWGGGFEVEGEEQFLTLISFPCGSGSAEIFLRDRGL